MDEYINRETLKQSLLTMGFYPVFVKTALEEAPAIDIVRCKDCRYWKKEYRFCILNGVDCYGNSPFDENGFCSRGERRDSDEIH